MSAKESNYFRERLVLLFFEKDLDSKLQIQYCQVLVSLPQRVGEGEGEGEAGGGGGGGGV